MVIYLTTRRRFLLWGTSAFGGVALTNCFARSLPSISSTATVLSSQAGLLDVVLTAQIQQLQLAGQLATLMTYNGHVPGPRLELRAGDTVRIQLINQLPHPTNLHFHGLHVSPSGTADNIFRHAAPGETLSYEFTIPKNHPAGIFYYHPHHHGTTADQVFAGLGGMLIIRGELDDIPEVTSAREEFLVLKDFAWDAQGQVASLGHMAYLQGREGPVVLVNGQVNPSLAIAPGGLLRLRLLNASASRFYRLALEEHPLHLIATDGGALARPITQSELLLTPGERADILIQGDRSSGQYRLLNLPYDRGGMMGSMMGNGMGMMHGGRIPDTQPRRSQTAQTLATVVYQGAKTHQPLPQTLLSVETLPNPQTVRRLEFSMAMGQMGQMGMTLMFNDQAFDPNRIDITVPLGRIEDWDLVNVGAVRMDHPFHLHINSFQVVSHNGQPPPDRAWKDTVLVRRGETVRIRIPFRDFPGKTVYHCHILDHQELGMMGLLNITA